MVAPLGEESPSTRGSSTATSMERSQMQHQTQRITMEAYAYSLVGAFWHIGQKSAGPDDGNQQLRSLRLFHIGSTGFYAS